MTVFYSKARSTKTRIETEVQQALEEGEKNSKARSTKTRIETFLLFFYRNPNNSNSKARSTKTRIETWSRR
ncbi:hypothetical protein MSSIT_3070 [Methanosarcina siciliae T4/M]|uniref:Uncharacterized protein n=1 Tax=Methanosarcina siciliae T4/M TaxID=1434120 RepID=A0A0E3P7C0_9EURY|nr:hypothetical protein MSSIT_3070 [Methanosarcina siciliae T4/M]